jgi:hypothetical protein
LEHGDGVSDFHRAHRARSDPPSLEVMPHGTRREVASNRLAASLRSALEFERSPLRRRALVLPLRGRRRIGAWRGGPCEIV